MKRTMVFGALLFICAGLFAQNVSLDQAIQTSTQAIETRLPKGAKTAVLTFTSAKQAFSDYVIDELATALSLSKNLQVIDRQHTDAIRKEFNVQFSGDVSDEEVKSIGKQLGAQYVVTGSLVDIGTAYRFRVAAINIESAVREGSPPLNININDPQVVFLLTGQRPTQTSNTPSNSGKIYKVGDYGPAGGIVFYDKGVFSGGWRYLEAAPVETEFRAQWGAMGQDVDGTVRTVGSGKRNTELIVERLQQLGESGRAAQLCADLNFDGFNDWFLPSWDELDLIYKNLKQKGLGDFGSSSYWSSSSAGTTYGSIQRFSDGRRMSAGTPDDYTRNRTNSVRAVRAF
jgi:TolB-like protein